MDADTTPIDPNTLAAAQCAVEGLDDLLIWRGSSSDLRGAQRLTVTLADGNLSIRVLAASGGGGGGPPFILSLPGCGEEEVYEHVDDVFGLFGLALGKRTVATVSAGIVDPDAWDGVEGQVVLDIPRSTFQREGRTWELPGEILRVRALD
jgi:hypothetical protein